MLSQTLLIVCRFALAVEPTVEPTLKSAAELNLESAVPPPALEVSVTPPVVDLDAQARMRYSQFSLRRTSGSAWVVVDGMGETLDVERWTTWTGDVTAARRTRASQRPTLNLGPRLVGVALIGLSSLLVLQLPETAQVSPESPRFRDSVSGSGWATFGFALGAGVGVGLVTVPFGREQDTRTRSPVLRNWISSAAVDRVIRQYNTSLAAELGVPHPPPSPPR